MTLCPGPGMVALMMVACRGRGRSRAAMVCLGKLGVDPRVWGIKGWTTDGPQVLQVLSANYIEVHWALFY